jgi:hypothetical protein
MSVTTVKFVRSDGKTMSIDDTALGLTAAKGLDAANVETFTQKSAVGDGDLVTGQRVGSREISFTARARNPALNEILKRAWTSFFTTGRTYDVYVTRYGNRRYAAGCCLDSFEVPTDNQYKTITLKISLICPEGYWLSVDSFGRNIAGVESRAGWPWIAQEGYGRIYGIYSYAGTVYLDNDGDAKAYCKAVFTAQGAVTNPKLIAGDGYVRVLTTLNEGDVMVIDGKTQSVTINGVNAATLIDKASSFAGIVFALGTNSIGFTADVGSNVVAVTVYYNKRYMGA